MDQVSDTVLVGDFSLLFICLYINIYTYIYIYIYMCVCVCVCKNIQGMYLFIYEKYAIV